MSESEATSETTPDAPAMTESTASTETPASETSVPSAEATAPTDAVQTAAATEADVPDITAVMGSADWVKHVPSEYVKAAGNYDSLGAFMKAHGELRTRLNDAVTIPGKDAAPDDWAKFFEKAGRPKAAADYTTPDFGEDIRIDPKDPMMETFRAWAFDAGMTQRQFDAVVTKQVQSIMTDRAKSEAAHAAAHKALRAEWGEEANGKYELARRSGTVLFTGEQRTALGLGDDPQTWPAPFAAALAAIAPTFANHRHLARQDRDAGKTDEQLKQEADTLQQSAKYMNGDPAAHKRVQEIYDQLYGTAPIAGRAA